MKPITIECDKETNAAAGVIATKPTIAPTHALTADIFLFKKRSYKIQVIILVEEAILVLAKETTASKLAAKAEPALKPNQPNHKSPYQEL